MRLESASLNRRQYDSQRMCDPYLGRSSSTRFNDHSSIGLRTPAKPPLTAQKPDISYISIKKTPMTPCTPIGGTIRSLNDSQPEMLFSRFRVDIDNSITTPFQRPCFGTEVPSSRRIDNMKVHQ